MFKPIFFKSRIAGLVFWLILIILVGPSLQGRFGFLWIAISLAVIPFLGVYAVSDSRRDMFIGMAMGLPTMVAVALWTLAGESAGDTAPITVPQALLFIGYYSATTVMILRHLFRHEKVTFDTLMGAAAVYLLVGFTFAIAYHAINDNAAAAFNLPYGDAGFDFADALFFSFVTLTTLGYGDIHPVVPLARSLAMLEAIGGVLYLAIIISRFVSLYQREDSADEST